MSTVRLGIGILAAAVVATTSVLFFREHRRDIQLQALQQELQDLRAQHGQLAAQTAADAAPVRQTGFFQAESRPAAGFRRMALTESGPDNKSETLYVALLPDLVVEDFAGTVRNPDGLVVRLNSSGRARLQAITGERTEGGREGREAILVDGEIVSAPMFREEIRASSLVISGRSLERSDWAEKLSREISAANKANAPAQ